MDGKLRVNIRETTPEGMNVQIGQDHAFIFEIITEKKTKNAHLDYNLVPNPIRIRGSSMQKAQKRR